MNLSKELLITSKHWWTKGGWEVFTWDARQYKGHPVECAQQEFVLMSEWVPQIWERGNLHDSVAAVLSLANHCSPNVNQHVWNTTLSVASTMALILPHNRVPAKHPQNHQKKKHKLQHFHHKSLTASSSCPGDGKAKEERQREKENVTLDQDTGAFIIGSIWARSAGNSSTTWISSWSDSTKWRTSKMSPKSLHPEIKFQSKLQYKENNIYGNSMILPFENSHN